jgi:hypothetical protein
MRALQDFHTRTVRDLLRDLDIPAISRHFAARTRTVLLAPYERFIDSGEPIRYPQLSSATRNAWLKIASAVAEGL